MVHLGVGNFHRAHQCVFSEDALVAADAAGAEMWGYVGVGLMPSDVKMRDALRCQDGLYTLWERGVSSQHVRIIGCHSDITLAFEDPESVASVLSAPSTKLVTMTVTEKGYYIDLTSGDLLFEAWPVQSDISHLKAHAIGSLSPKTHLKTAHGYIVCASSRRMRSGHSGFTVLSCDNIQENGAKFQKAVLQMADAVDPAVKEWMEQNVTFPNSMVDRITPMTTDEMRCQLAKDFNIQDRWPVVCEHFLLWVVEDKFPYGRPSWERSESGKFILTDNVVPYELMKLRLLNAVHQALSYPASLLGYIFVHESMADERVSGFVRQYMRVAAKTCPDVQGLSKAEWIDTVIGRFMDPSIKDTIFRLTEDATNRLGVALAPCLHADAVHGKRPLNREDTELITLPLTCWMRCLLAESVGPFPAKNALNHDDKKGGLTVPAANLWNAVKNGQPATEVACVFLKLAFGEQVSRPEVGSVLTCQLRILQDEGVEALLGSVRKSRANTSCFSCFR
eukprot:TRINITY_DN18621_c0_g2_i1.p1 TRINITY_DN18621_c0_g2~~TRINITY_DN18621_c0_g2_i1.p1  ORF type:complete len:556 (+),score=49.59 TRINITY_DN18621_c0_g2_i1:152-1669(+)